MSTAETFQRDLVRLGGLRSKLYVNVKDEGCASREALEKGNARLVLPLIGP
jgi:hypothetical protein